MSIYNDPIPLGTDFDLPVSPSMLAKVINALLQCTSSMPFPLYTDTTVSTDVVYDADT